MVLTPTVAGLTKKRAELVIARNALAAELRRVTADINHMDAAIRLFDPKATPSAVRQRVTKHRTKKGQTRRFVLDTLRGATGPLTARDIAEAYAAALRLRADEDTLVVMRRRVGDCLIALRGLGQVQDAGMVGAYKGWRSV